MYGSESWTIKKAECRRIDAFELWCWRRLLRVPWTARRSNQSILMEISPEYALEDWCWSWNCNTLATWCSLELSHWKRPWSWERLKVGGEGDDRGWDGWMASPTQWSWVWVSSGNWWTGKPDVLQPTGSQRVRHNWMTELTVDNHLPNLSLALIFPRGLHWFLLDISDQSKTKLFFFPSPNSALYPVSSILVNDIIYLVTQAQNLGIILGLLFLILHAVH